jgi:hypothetical protein
VATYRVTFEKPVVYHGGTLRAKTLTEMEVHAPDGQAAITHAIRVTEGDPGQVTARLLADQVQEAPQ